MNIAIGSDHAGFEQKEHLRTFLEGQGHSLADCGCFDAQRCDYPDFAAAVARKVAAGDAEFGVLVCGTGIGMSMAANKVAGVRCANPTTVDFARLAREHNDANVVALSGRFVDEETNERIVEAFLSTPFSGDRHEARVAKIMDLD